MLLARVRFHQSFSSKVNFPASISSSATQTYVCDCGFLYIGFCSSRLCVARLSDKSTGVYLELILFCKTSMDGSNLLSFILQYLFILFCKPFSFAVFTLNNRLNFPIGAIYIVIDDNVVISVHHP